MEQFDISGSTVIQTVFQRNIIDKGFVLLYIIACRYASTDNHSEPVVPESFGKLEIIVSTVRSVFLVCTFHSHVQVKTACYVVNLSLQEAVECIIGIKITR